MKEIVTEIEIHATPERVWKVLTDCRAYSEWNPFVYDVRGEIEVGNHFEAMLKTPERRPVKLRGLVLKMVPRREFRWQGNLGFTGLFDGEYVFEIHSPAPKLVRFTNRKVYKGLLTSMVFSRTIDRIRRGVEAMNFALKQRCES